MLKKMERNYLEGEGVNHGKEMPNYFNRLVIFSIMIYQ